MLHVLLSRPSHSPHQLLQAREGISTTVTGIGPDAVSNACVAVCHSRIYLEVRWEAYRLWILLGFERVHLPPCALHRIPLYHSILFPQIACPHPTPTIASSRPHPAHRRMTSWM